MIINDYARTMLMRKEGLSEKILVSVVKHLCKLMGLYYANHQ